MKAISLLWRLVSGPAGWLLSATGTIGRWMLADWRNGPLALFSFALFVHVFVIDPRLNADLEAGKTRLSAERTAHAKTIEDFIAASRRAGERQAANLDRVRREQTAINERVSDEFQDGLAALRSRARELAALRSLPAGADRGSDRAGGLRAGAAAAIDPGASGRAAMPSASFAPGGAAQASGDHRLPEMSPAEMSLRERLVASEQALQLDALIGWVLDQARLRTSPEPAAP